MAQVAPTKGNLMAAKNTLKLSEQGYEMLDKKRNILIREMMSLIDEAKTIENDIEDTCIQKEGYAVSIEKQQNVYTIIAIDDNGNTLEKIRVRKMGGKYAQNG